MSLFKVPAKVLLNMESIKCHFFNGIEHNGKKLIWVKWNKVLASKEKGGLGVLSFYALNRALLFKWVWRFCTQQSALWTKIIKGIHEEDGKIGKHMGNEVDIRFWEDKWRGDNTFQYEFPRMYALETQKNISVALKLSHDDLLCSFRRAPRAGAEELQYIQLVKIMEGITLFDSNDRWRWSLEDDVDEDGKNEENDDDGDDGDDDEVDIVSRCNYRQQETLSSLRSRNIRQFDFGNLNSVDAFVLCWE
ncbi:hypothetical protein Tco_0336354 [Tanacetum coccineum]